MFEPDTLVMLLGREFGLSYGIPISCEGTGNTLLLGLTGTAVIC